MKKEKSAVGSKAAKRRYAFKQFEIILIFTPPLTHSAFHHRPLGGQTTLPPIWRTHNLTHYPPHHSGISLPI